MSIIDKVIAAVTPPESEEERMEARSRANAASMPGDWLALILKHHLRIEDAFAEVKVAGDAGARRAALKRLGILLTGHANAEEAVIYPALAEEHQKGHAAAGYEEQAMVKVQMALLEKIDPMSQDFIDKLEHIEGAVAHHVYAEEGNWFLDLKERATPEDQAVLARRYAEEYDRYVGGQQGL